jgi:hypothetical protein
VASCVVGSSQSRFCCGYHVAITGDDDARDQARCGIRMWFVGTSLHQCSPAGSRSMSGAVPALFQCRRFAGRTRVAGVCNAQEANKKHVVGLSGSLTCAVEQPLGLIYQLYTCSADVDDLVSTWWPHMSARPARLGILKYYLSSRTDHSKALSPRS